MSMTELCTPCHLGFIEQAPLHFITSRLIHRTGAELHAC